MLRVKGRLEEVRFLGKPPDVLDMGGSRDKGFLMVVEPERKEIVLAFSEASVYDDSDIYPTKGDLFELTLGTPMADAEIKTDVSEATEVAPSKTVARTGLLEVSRTYKDGAAVTKETVGEEMIEVQPFATTPAEVEYASSMTLNLGDYESVRVHIGVKLPCYVQECSEAFFAAKKMVESRLNKEVSEIREWRKKKGRE